MTEDIEGFRCAILKNRFSVWRAVPDSLDRTADPEHTVVRFPNSSTYVFSTGTDLFWMMDPSYNMEPCPEPDLKRIADRIRERFSFILVTHLHDDHCQRDSSAFWRILPSAG